MAPLNQYQPLSQQEISENLEDIEKCNDGSSVHSAYSIQKSTMKSPLGMALTQWIPWILVISLISSNWYTWLELRSFLPQDAIFTLPEQSSIRYRNVVFAAGIDGDFSPYQGTPTPDNNALWDELYEFGVIKLSIDEAKQLKNRTIPISSDPQHYSVIISVFHQLHCLNRIRQRVFWNETKQGSIDNKPEFNMKHMDHCIDSLRQSLMCSSDLSPIPYAWNTKYQQNMPIAATTHTCRDFEAIKEWARADERRANAMDAHVRVEDPLGNVEYTPPDSLDI